LYLPSEDTFLLAKTVEGYTGKSALEIGVGSGAVLKVLRENFQIVAGTDIDFVSVKHCKENLPNDIMLACCDSASAIRYKFELIVSNPPYLPVEDKEKKDSAIHGDSNGVESTLRFIKSAVSLLAENGKMLIIISSLSNTQKIAEFIVQKNLKKRTISEKKLFFETLTTIEISF
jgi:release factor glutamine methyltransferase